MTDEEVMALLDAAANENGYAKIEGVGMRRVFQYAYPTGLYYWIADKNRWIAPDGRPRFKTPWEYENET